MAATQSKSKTATKTKAATDAQKERINKAYREVLGRNADSSGLKAYAGVSEREARQLLAKSDKAKSKPATEVKDAQKERINKAYREVLGRNADSSGLKAYAGVSEKKMRQLLAESDEAKSKGVKAEDWTGKAQKERDEQQKFMQDVGIEKNGQYVGVSDEDNVKKGSYFTLAEGAKAGSRAYKAFKLEDGTQVYVKGDKSTTGLAGKVGLDKVIGKDVYKAMGAAASVSAAIPGFGVSTALLGDEVTSIVGGTKGAANYRKGSESVLGKRGAKYFDVGGDAATSALAGAADVASGGSSFGGFTAANEALKASEKASTNQKIDWADAFTNVALAAVGSNLGRVGLGVKGTMAASAVLSAGGSYARDRDLKKAALSGAISLGAQGLDATLFKNADDFTRAALTAAVSGGSTYALTKDMEQSLMQAGLAGATSYAIGSGRTPTGAEPAPAGSPTPAPGGAVDSAPEYQDQIVRDDLGFSADAGRDLSMEQSIGGAQPAGPATVAPPKPGMWDSIKNKVGLGPKAPVTPAEPKTLLIDKKNAFLGMEKDSFAIDNGDGTYIPVGREDLGGYPDSSIVQVKSNDRALRYTTTQQQQAGRNVKMDKNAEMAWKVPAAIGLVGLGSQWALNERSMYEQKKAQDKANAREDKLNAEADAQELELYNEYAAGLGGGGGGSSGGSSSGGGASTPSIWN